MLCSSTLRDIQWSMALTGSDMTTGTHLCRWNLEVSESHLCFLTMLRSLPKGGICPLLGTIWAWRTAQCTGYSWKSPPFPPVSDPARVPYPLKVPRFSPFREKVPLEPELPFSILWPLNESLFCLHQTQFPYWQREPEQERTPWPGKNSLTRQGDFGSARAPRGGLHVYFGNRPNFLPENWTFTNHPRNCFCRSDL